MKIKIVRHVRPEQEAPLRLVAFVEAEVSPHVGWDIRDYAGRTFPCVTDRPRRIDVQEETRAGWSVEK